MNIKLFAKGLIVAATTATCLLISSCSEDDNPVGTVEQSVGTGNENAYLVTRADEKVSYIQAIDLSVAAVNGTVSQANATQIMTDMAYLWTFGKNAYVGGYDIAEIGKYEIGAGGVVERIGALAVPANCWPADIEFISSEKAYLTSYYDGTIIVFNPSTMTEIKKIDLNQYAAEGYLVSPAEMIVQGNRLLVTLQQMMGQMAMDANAHMVSIDLTSDTVIAHFKDPRTAWAGVREALSGMMLDENGDLYVGCSALFGMASDIKGGVLRVKNGANEFDPDYFWDIRSTSAAGEPASAVGGNGSLYAMVYVGGTRGVGSVINYGYMAAGEDPMTGHYFKPVAFDFIAKTLTVLDIPAGGGYGHGMAVGENEVFFSIEGVESDGVYAYDVSTGTAKKLFTTELEPISIAVIQK